MRRCANLGIERQLNVAVTGMRSRPNLCRHTLLLNEATFMATGKCETDGGKLTIISSGMEVGSGESEAATVLAREQPWEVQKSRTRTI